MNAYVVIRVPKCGSTSLSKMMTSAMPQSKIFNISSADLDLMKEENEYISAFEQVRILKNKTLSNWKNHNCLSFDAVWNKTNKIIKNNDIVLGHFTVDAIQLQAVGKRLVTVIRDPFERILSDYNYARLSYDKKPSVSKKYRTKAYVAGNYSLEGYIDYLRESRPVYKRFMSRFILGKNNIDDPVSFLEENYFSYGVLERMDLFVGDFHKKSGVELIQQKANVTNSKAIDDLSNSARKLIADFCEEDIHLYQCIRNVIEK